MLKMLSTVCVVLFMSSLTIGTDTEVAEHIAKRDIAVKEHPMCKKMMGEDYPYICSSDMICLHCPNKKIGNGVCQVCNGKKECPGGEDEIGCEVRSKPFLNPTCSKSKYPYSCATMEPSGTTKCLSKDQICDGLWDCSDESDEKGCDYTQYYGTANGQCQIPSQKKIGSKGEARFDAQMLEAHNYFRCLHGAGAMTSSKKMNTRASTAVGNSAASGGLKHSFTGENLAMIQLPIADATGFGITKLWYDEIKDYNYADYRQSTGVVGHFTQVVWANSLKLGCANTVDTNGDTQIACEYDPPGNLATVKGHVTNVRQPVS